MTPINNAPFFTIVISTRDRPELFQVALQSVRSQTFSDREIVAVVDGSSDGNLEQYRALEQQLPDVRFDYIEQRPRGHGQSYSMNVGVHESNGRYLCFLDDDDNWTDDGYLENVFANIAASEETVDLHYSNQTAVFSDGTIQTESVWVEDLIDRVGALTGNRGDSYFADAAFMLSSSGFAHLNCSVIRRELYDSIGGMDESIRYENDRDVYIRCLNAGKVILFSTRVMSLHNIPDKNQKSNMSTTASDMEKKLYQIRVYDKGISLATKPAVVRFCCRAKTYEIKHMATILARREEYRGAAHYARAALMSGFNFRWLGYTLYLAMKSFLSPENGAETEP